MILRATLFCLAAVASLLAPPEAAGAERPLPPEAQLRDILERPLFARSRQPGGGPVEPIIVPRPPEAHGQEPRAAQAEDIAVQVMGVLIAPPTRKALLRFGDAPPAWLAEGASAEGWRVSVVEEAGVVLSGAAGDVRLDLHEPPR